MIPDCDPQTQESIKEWLEGDYDVQTKRKLREALSTNPESVIDAFHTRLAFGTGGLRGLVGIGPNRLNIYTVQVTSQGVANAMKNRFSSTPLRLFVGYDSRNTSQTFAEQAARVFTGNEIQVYLCKELRPTPLISFGCRHFHCQAAVMITASHNPPEYNGYKLYWEDGGQVTPPYDELVIKEVEKIRKPSQIAQTNTLHNPFLHFVGKELDAAYLDALYPYMSCLQETQREGDLLRVVFTPLHGTGGTLIPTFLRHLGFSKLDLVKEQSKPDGNFPTVAAPNPEDPAALSLGFTYMKERKADLLVATDPDADRMGAACLHDGKPERLNGNEILCLLLDHICQSLRKSGKFPHKAAFIKTIATTELFKKIVEKYGGTSFDVLIGFKYIASMIHKFETNREYTFIFGGEESYGYLRGTHARDKDGVLASGLMAETAFQLKKQGKTCIDRLYELYQEHGVYVDKLLSVRFPDTKRGREDIGKILPNLRKHPPKQIGGTRVAAMEDYQHSVRHHFSSEKQDVLLLPRSEVVTFWLEDKTKLMVRPSGTEAKVKIYCSVSSRALPSVATALKNCRQRAEMYLQFMEKRYTSNGEPIF